MSPDCQRQCRVAENIYDQLERSTWKKSRKFESNLECPGLVLEPLLVFVNIGLCDVKPKVVHIRSLVQEVRHPVHVPTGRVKEAYPFLAKNFLEVISNFEQMQWNLCQ